MRRLRAWLVTPHSGGLGTRSGGTMAALRGARCIGPAQMRGSRNADPGTEKPRWSAERRPRSPKESAANGRTGAPLGAPSPQAFCLGEKRLSLIHISEPTRLGMISYAVFCLKKKKKTI